MATETLRLVDVTDIDPVAMTASATVHVRTIATGIDHSFTFDVDMYDPLPDQIQTAVDGNGYDVGL